MELSYPNKLLVIGVTNVSILILRPLILYFSNLYDSELDYNEAIEIWDYKDLNIHDSNLGKNSLLGSFFPDTNKSVHVCKNLGVLDGKSPIAKDKRLNSRLLNKSIRNVFPLIISFTKDKDTHRSISDTITKRFKDKDLEDCIYIVISKDDINLASYITNSKLIYDIDLSESKSKDFYNSNSIEEDMEDIKRDYKEIDLFSNKRAKTNSVVNDISLGSSLITLLDEVIHTIRLEDLPISIRKSNPHFEYPC